MAITYVTFGQVHRHEINGKVFDKDCVARIKCDGPVDGREKAFAAFGPAFCFEYHEGEFDPRSMKYFPRGFVDLEEPKETFDE